VFAQDAKRDPFGLRAHDPRPPLGGEKVAEGLGAAAGRVGFEGGEELVVGDKALHARFVEGLDELMRIQRTCQVQQSQ